MHTPTANVYNPKTFVLKAQTPWKREILNIAKKKKKGVSSA